MHTSAGPYTAGLAAAGVGILTLGLVSAPLDLAAKIPRPEVRAVQLAAVTSAEINAVVPYSATSGPIYAAAAATPRAEASPAPETVIGALVATALLVPVAAVWYAGFPITLPLSIFVAGTVLRLTLGTINPVTAVTLGVAGFVGLPIAALGATLSALRPTPASTAPATSDTPRPTPNENRGITSLRRSTAANAHSRAASSTTKGPAADRAKRSTADAGAAKIRRDTSSSTGDSRRTNGGSRHRS